MNNLDVNISDLIIAVVTSVASISAIFISASISRKAEQENHKRTFLSDAYSNLFSKYTRWLETKDTHDKATLLASIAQARLLAAPDTELLLEDFEKSIIRNASISELGNKLGPLRYAMRTELKQNKKKTSKERQKK